MKRRIPEDKLREMMGHDFVGMTDYFIVIDLAELQEQFLGLRGHSRAIDSFWE